jgi:hypothetical protein
MDLMLQHEAIVLLFTFYYRYNVDVDFHLYCIVLQAGGVLCVQRGLGRGAGRYNHAK